MQFYFLLFNIFRVFRQVYLCGKKTSDSLISAACNYHIFCFFGLPQLLTLNKKNNSAKRKRPVVILIDYDGPLAEDKGFEPSRRVSDLLP